MGSQTLRNLVLSAALALPIGGCDIFKIGEDIRTGLKEGAAELADHLKDITGIVRLYEDNINLRKEVAAAKAKGKVAYAPPPPLNSSITLLALASTSDLRIVAEAIHPDGKKDLIRRGIFPNTLESEIQGEEYAKKLITATLPSISTFLTKDGTYSIECTVDPKYGHGAYAVAVIIEDPNTKERKVISPTIHRSDRDPNTFQIPLAVGPAIGDESKPKPGKTAEEILQDRWKALFGGLKTTYESAEASKVQLDIERQGKSVEGRTRQENLLQRGKNELKCYKEHILDFLNKNPNPIYQMEYDIFVKCHPVFNEWTK